MEAVYGHGLYHRHTVCSQLQGCGCLQRLPRQVWLHRHRVHLAPTCLHLQTCFDEGKVIRCMKRTLLLLLQRRLLNHRRLMQSTQLVLQEDRHPHHIQDPITLQYRVATIVRQKPSQPKWDLAATITRRLARIHLKIQPSLERNPIRPRVVQRQVQPQPHCRLLMRMDRMTLQRPKRVVIRP